MFTTATNRGNKSCGNRMDATKKGDEGNGILLYALATNIGDFKE